MIKGILCLNTECEHYFEDNCTHFFQKDTISVGSHGKCKTFKKGINIGYQQNGDIIALRKKAII